MFNEERFAQIIHASRKRLGLTQKKVSELTGITQGTLSKIENYEISVSARNWFLLSQALDIPHHSAYCGFIDRGLKAKKIKTTSKNIFKMPTKYRKNACSTVKDLMPFILFVQKKYGADSFKDFLKEVSVPEYFFIDLNNKINFLFAYDLLIHFCGNITDELLNSVARCSTMKEAHGTLIDIYKKKHMSLGKLKAYIKRADFYESCTDYSIVEKGNEKLIIELDLSEYLQEQMSEEFVETFVLPYRINFLKEFANDRVEDKFDLSVSKKATQGHYMLEAQLIS